MTERWRCGQLVAPGDSCCEGVDRTCGREATWLHEAGGVALCDEHEANARRFGGPELGRWTVGRTTVSYPDGWSRIEVAAAGDPPSLIAVVREGE